MYTPGAPQFHLNPGTAALMLYCLDNPQSLNWEEEESPLSGPEPMECSYDWDDVVPSRLHRQNALSPSEWEQLMMNF